MTAKNIAHAIVELLTLNFNLYYIIGNCWLITVKRFVVKCTYNYVCHDVKWVCDK